MNMTKPRDLILVANVRWWILRADAMIGGETVSVTSPLMTYTPK
jgi:hypothetical protein